MHRAKFYDAAISLYELYLGQQPDTRSLDSLIARFYAELAKVRVDEPKNLRYVGRKPDMKSLKTDLVRAMKKLPAAETIYASVEELLQDQETFYDSYAPIKKIVETLPVEWNVGDVPMLEKALKDIEGCLEAIPSDTTRAQAEAEFADIMGKLSRRIAELKAKDILSNELMKPKSLCRLDRYDEFAPLASALTDALEPKGFAFSAEEYDPKQLFSSKQLKAAKTLSAHAGRLADMKAWIRAYQEGQHPLHDEILAHSNDPIEDFRNVMSQIEERHENMAKNLADYGDPAVDYTSILAAIDGDFAMVCDVKHAKERAAGKERRRNAGWTPLGFGLILVSILFALCLGAAVVLGWFPASRMFSVDWHETGIFEAWLTDFPMELWLPMSLCAGGALLFGALYAILWFVVELLVSREDHSDQNIIALWIGALPVIALAVTLLFHLFCGAISAIFLWSSGLAEKGWATFGTALLCLVPFGIPAIIGALPEEQLGLWKDDGWEPFGVLLLFVALLFTVCLGVVLGLGWIPISRMFVIDWHYTGIFEAWLTDFPMAMWLPMVICAAVAVLLFFTFLFLVFVVNEEFVTGDHEIQTIVCWVMGGIPVGILILTLIFYILPGFASGIFLWSSGLVEKGWATFGTSLLYPGALALAELVAWVVENLLQ